GGGARARVRDGARRALPARGRRRRLRDRLRPAGGARRLPPPRGHAGRLGAVALLDAPAALDAERVQRVARVRDRPVGSRERLPADLAELRALRGAARARGGPLEPAATRAARAARAEGSLPARQPPALQPEVPAVLAAAIRRLRTPPRPAARRDRGARGRGLPALQRPGAAVTPSVAGGLALALGSAAALDWGFLAQHGAAASLPPLGLRRPLRAARLLLGSRRWLAGFLVGIGGWALYVAALRLAPLSLAQAASAGGVGLLAVLVERTTGVRLARREWTGVGLAVAGTAVLAVSLAGGASASRRAEPVAVVLWVAGSLAVAGLATRRPAAGAGFGLAAGILYAAGDVPAVLACHGLGFVALQLGFQRGGALATAGVATLLTNGVPIAAGMAVF